MRNWLKTRMNMETDSYGAERKGKKEEMTTDKFNEMLGFLFMLVGGMFLIAGIAAVIYIMLT